MWNTQVKVDPTPVYDQMGRPVSHLKTTNMYLALSGRPSLTSDEEGFLDRVLLVRARLPHEELQGPAQVQEAPPTPIHTGGETKSQLKTYYYTFL